MLILFDQHSPFCYFIDEPEEMSYGEDGSA